MKTICFLCLVIPLAFARAEFPAVVDVAVVGGSFTAVAAALAAKETGASVALVAPRPYLGDDVAGTLRLEAAPDDDWSHPLMGSIWGTQDHPATNVTPIQIKKTLDEAVLAAGISVRCWSVPIAMLNSADQTPAGLVFASRNGLETLRAKTVVWAMPQGFTGQFRRRILAAEPPVGPGLRVRELPRTETVKITGRKTGAKDVPAEFKAHLYECEASFAVPYGGTFLADCCQQFRDLTWVPSLVDASDQVVCYDFPPPGRALAEGTRLGREAAQKAKAMSVLPEAQPFPEAFALPVITECDVFVAGAGTAGAPAAIAAARAGMKTVVCDYAWKMGGVMTEGRIGNYWYGNRVGFTREIDAAMPEAGWIFSEAKAEWFRRECRKAGATILFGTMVFGTVVEDNRVVGVKVAFADGRVGIIRCKTAIDATGNADLAAFSGARTEFIDGKELALQGATFARQSLGASYQNSDFAFYDDTNPDDLTWTAMRGRRGGGGWNQAQVPSSRERRRIIGAYQVTAADEMNGRTYPDVICVAKSNFDSHGQTVDPLFFLLAPPHTVKSVNLPYRALLPETLDGLLVTGLGMSATRDAMPILRMQPDVQNQGYAAGLASAQAVRKGCTVRDIDVKELQRELVEKGIVPESVLSMPDNFPLPDEALRTAVSALASPTEKNPYPGLQALVSDPERALPLVKEAWADAAPESDAHFRYALALALLGDASGVGDILPRVTASDWDKGWNYRGMGQFGRSVSDVDGWILMLGRVRAKEAVPAIVAKAEALDAVSTYSHFRSVAFALEEISDVSAVPTLSRLLRLPKVGGHALAPDAAPPVKTGGDGERTLCLRELCLARALYRLGDDADGLGRATLEAYAKDPRGAYAEHARKVLEP